MDIFYKAINLYNEYIGTYLLLFTLLPIGLYYAVRLRFFHLAYFPHSIKTILGIDGDTQGGEGDISNFKALMTALSATIGTGNIVGVALAIYWGGPGAIFWMWMTGLFGMVLKFSECTLAIKYREVQKDGTISGGPMYYIQRALKDKIGKRMSSSLAIFFSISTLICSFGTGNMAQTHSISDALFTNYNSPHLLNAIILSSFVFLVIVGGIQRIAKVTSALVPFMSFFYLVSAGIILFLFRDKIPTALNMIFVSAFKGSAIAGGGLGATFLYTLRFGMARGLFSNEAGQGSAPIAFAAAKSKYAVQEGLVASLGPFIDTIIVCTITALTIMVTDVWALDTKGVGMTIKAFSVGLGPLKLSIFGKHIVSTALILFALSTCISWSYYGERAIIFLIGNKGLLIYRIIYSLFSLMGALGGIDIVWSVIDMGTSMMTLSNLIALSLLSPIVIKEVSLYKKDLYKRQLRKRYEPVIS